MYPPRPPYSAPRTREELAIATRGDPGPGLSGREPFMRSFWPPRGGSSDRAAPCRSLDPAALPALLRATHLFGLALGSAFGRLRESGATAARLFERAEESALLLRMVREAAGILGARWEKVFERHRPHYAPEQRFRILRIRSFLGLSQRETAEMFRVSTETIARWEMETTGADGEAPHPAPRPLVTPNPPVRRFADVVRAMVKTMELARAPPAVLSSDAEEPAHAGAPRTNRSEHTPFRRETPRSSLAG
jgi:DNA-binding XRE family transcriptional regulator